jgi:hypothetical protein
MPTPNGREEPDLRERPIGEVARDLTRDLSLLVRQEVELAKSEMAQKGRTAAPGLGMIGGAGVVGLILAAAAYVLVMRGKERVEQAGSPVPEQTIETIKEDVEWAKTRATSARR